MGKSRFNVLMKSGMSPYVATTDGGRQVATLHRPTWPKQPSRLDMEGRMYTITHGASTNNFLLNDYQHALMDGEAELASCIAKPGMRTTEVAIGDATYLLVRRNRWGSVRYALEDSGGRELGGIVETTGFSLWRRKFRLEVPEGIGGAQAMFLFHLVAAFSFR